MSIAAQTLAQRFELSDDELLEILDVSAIELLSGQLEYVAQLPLLLALTEELTMLPPGVLPRWVRSKGPYGRPIDLLVANDFPAFERAVDDLIDRGFVIGG